MALAINGPQRGALSAALESAFPSPMLLQQVILHKLNDNIFNYAGFGSDYPQIRFNLVQQYNAQYRIDRLVAALLEASPTNEKLLEFAWTHGLLQRGSTLLSSSRSLERMLDDSRGFSNPVEFLQRFGKILQCVCQVRVETNKGPTYGTGFLIGDSSIITNYHVVQAAIEKQGSDHRRVSFRFDFRTGPDGSILTEGATYRTIDDAQAWVVDSSPYHPGELRVMSTQENLALARSAQHLDYAVLRVAGAPGAQSPGEKPLLGAGTGSAVRGHLDFEPAGYDYTKDFDAATAALFIMQHPNGDSLAFDHEKPAILGVNCDGTRVLYKVNTEPGSSGSPCFNGQLRWIALHHAGDSNWTLGHRPQYNEGVPVAAIRALLESRGKLRDSTL